LATDIYEATMAWFKITAPNGSSVYVSGDQLARVRIPDGEVTPKAKAIIDFANGQFQATLEGPDEVMALIDGKAAPARKPARREK
jgi:hypothetical protein